jgi:hypothetical protein
LLKKLKLSCSGRIERVQRGGREAAEPEVREVGLGRLEVVAANCKVKT